MSMFGSSYEEANGLDPERDSPLNKDQSGLEPIGICHVCEHRTSMFPPQCRAFPDGIPMVILVGNFIHTEPYEGDHGIQFKHKGGLKLGVEATLKPE